MSAADAKKAAVAKSAAATRAAAKKISAAKKAAVSSFHPPYTVMVLEAVTRLNEKNGSRQAAVVKYLDAKYKLCATSRHLRSTATVLVRSALRRLVASNQLLHDTASCKAPARAPDNTAGAFKQLSYKAMILEAVYSRKLKAVYHWRQARNHHTREDIDKYLKKNYRCYYKYTGTGKAESDITAALELLVKEGQLEYNRARLYPHMAPQPYPFRFMKPVCECRKCAECEEEPTCDACKYAYAAGECDDCGNRRDYPGDYSP
jgi:hypothetical protein